MTKENTYKFKSSGATIALALHKELMSTSIWQSVKCSYARLNWTIQGRPYRRYRRGKERCKHCGLLLQYHIP